jgi:hypothetical protein
LDIYNSVGKLFSSSALKYYNGVVDLLTKCFPLLEVSEKEYIELTRGPDKWKTEPMANESMREYARKNIPEYQEAYENAKTEADYEKAKEMLLDILIVPGKSIKKVMAPIFGHSPLRSDLCPPYQADVYLMLSKPWPLLKLEPNDLTRWGTLANSIRTMHGFAEQKIPGFLEAYSEKNYSAAKELLLSALKVNGVVSRKSFATIFSWTPLLKNHCEWMGNKLLALQLAFPELNIVAEDLKLAKKPKSYY